MTPSEMEAFLAEMEPDIRAADRDLRDIDMLDKKDVTAANRLPEYRTLQPRLDTLLQAQEEIHRKREELEQRIAKVMNQYASKVSLTLSFELQFLHLFRRRMLSQSFSLLGMILCTTRKHEWQRSGAIRQKESDSACHNDSLKYGVLCRLPHPTTASNVIFRSILDHLGIIFVAREGG